ncbi:phosphotransferase enzyme family protein [Litoreibacter roseus]|uniref:Homoserine kinase n=1 Tax=Litoreibacter roseus TaxID=2601869 RepID=A0A6N6JI68_9RHOB|nr:phosphotransferase [Litoreibacter roseus]GFE64978.1 homoserine kinase [Litoreibacter roseus]
MIPDAILSQWGPLAAPPRLIRDRENAVYEVQFADGTHAALRLHRTGYQSAEGIRSELRWTERLADTGFPCPRPLRTKAGDLIADGMPCASVVTWIDAAPIGENGVPFDGPLAEQCALYERLGRLIKRLHQTTDRLDQSGITRPHWDLDALLGPDPLWGRFWDNPALAPAEVETLLIARGQAAEALAALENPDIGLIHADLLQENILQADDALSLIDFDDSGMGYRLYDLGTALIQHAENPDLDSLADALCRGYDAPGARAAVPLFMMLRAFASCGWIISRTGADDPRQRFYAERALRCVDRFQA